MARRLTARVVTEAKTVVRRWSATVHRWSGPDRSAAVAVVPDGGQPRQSRDPRRRRANRWASARRRVRADPLLDFRPTAMKRRRLTACFGRWVLAAVGRAGFEPATKPL